MKNHYYRPIIKAKAMDGTLKHGVTLYTKIWNNLNPNLKMELTINAPTEEIARISLKNFITHNNFMHEWPAVVIDKNKNCHVAKS